LAARKPRMLEAGHTPARRMKHPVTGTAWFYLSASDVIAFHQKVPDVDDHGSGVPGTPADASGAARIGRGFTVCPSWRDLRQHLPAERCRSRTSVSSLSDRRRPRLVPLVPECERVRPAAFKLLICRRYLPSARLRNTICKPFQDMDCLEFDAGLLHFGRVSTHCVQELTMSTSRRNNWAISPNT